MKGIVFVELLAMADEAFGEDVVDNVIETSDLPSGGAYTAVGDYPCEELITIVQGLSRQSGISKEELQRLFGHKMMESFKTHYPHFFENRSGSLELLEAVENEIHFEVRKLYPNAELPKFEIKRLGPGALEMTYFSSRPLVNFCHGLIEASVEQFGETANITLSDQQEQDINSARFQIRLGKQ